MNRRKPAIAPPLEKITLSVEEAAAACGLGQSTIRRLIREGKLPARRIGTRLLICRADLETFCMRATLVRPPISEKAHA
jgi:excisionase family DNA binding protein